MIVNPNAHVDRRELDAIRGHLKACRATEVLDAVAVYDACLAGLERATAEGSIAHRRPHQARARHHDLVVHETMAGREPDDRALWAEVLDADRDLLRAKACHSAAQTALNRAAYALRDSFTRAWPSVLPYVAEHRHERLAGLDVLCQAITWPALTDSPGVETLADVGHFSLWWPLLFDVQEPYRRQDRTEWNEWAWAELAAGRFDFTDGGIAFQQRWTPPRYSSTTDEGTRQRLQPVVIVTPERIASYHEQLVLRR